MVETGFVGRDEQLGLLGSALAEAASGRPGVAVVQGPAGIGKTALVRRFFESHPETRVAWATGYESETLLAFGVVEQVRRAAGLAVVGPDESAADHLAVGARLVEWLAERAGDSPLAVVVDDAPWADPPSLLALGFALRRLVAEPVLAVFVGRDDDLAALPPGVQRSVMPDTAVRLDLGGLGETDVIALSAAMGCKELSRPAARRLVAHTGGNPLHVRALLRELDPALLSDLSTGPLPAPASFSMLVVGNLARLGTPAQNLVAAAAVLGMRFRLGDAVVVAGLSDPANALDEAVHSGLLEVRPGNEELVFPHPLVQAAVYHDLAPGRRSGLHAAAAELATTTADALRHRGAAALDGDPDLAADLAAFAAAQAERGSWAAAADAYLTAARLAPDSVSEPLFLSGVECLVLGGDTPAALSKRERVEACGASARRDYVLGLMSAVNGNRLAAHRLLDRAWAALTADETASDLAGDAELVTKIASQLSMVAINEGRADEAVMWAGHALAGAVTPNRGIARAVQALGFGEMGRFAEGIAAMGEAPGDPEAFDADRTGALLGRGVLRQWIDELDGAVEDLSLAEEAARRLGPLYLRIIALFYLAEAEYRRGAWDDATMHAELATSLAADAGEVWTLGLAHSVAALPAAGRGDWARAEAHLSAAEKAAAVLGDAANQLWVLTAHARLAQSRGDHAAVLSATQTILDLDMGHGRQQPGIQPWALLRAEALVKQHRPEEAGNLLDPVEERSEATNHASLRVAVGRIRGLIAADRKDRDLAEAAFENSVGISANNDVEPLESALLRLDYGSYLRRRGRRGAAADHLARARAVLTRLGASPFLQRCDAELSACGLVPAAHGDRGRSLLTPQEQAVAALVAIGLTNRQVAERLVISTKGVGYHLGNIFAKLGVHTRAELAARIARTETAPTSAD